MDKEKYFQCFLLKGICYQDRGNTEKWRGVENMPLSFSKYLQSCGS